jgi:2'-5' RNA ligase
LANLANSTSPSPNMARQLPLHLSHKSALVLLPPANIAAPIEGVRRTHDKNFERWPAHINLLYPFLSSPSETSGQGEDSHSSLKPDIRVRIARAVQDIRSFHITLNADPPGFFSHGKGGSKTVWLGPTTDNVQRLQAVLQQEFAEVNADRRPFVPHLSVGQVKSEARLDELRTLIRKRIAEHLDHSPNDEVMPAALDWHVDQVCVIQRNTYNDRFKVVETIKL